MHDRTADRVEQPLRRRAGPRDRPCPSSRTSPSAGTSKVRSMPALSLGQPAAVEVAVRREQRRDAGAHLGPRGEDVRRVGRGVSAAARPGSGSAGGPSKSTSWTETGASAAVLVTASTVSRMPVAARRR